MITAPMTAMETHTEGFAIAFETSTVLGGVALGHGPHVLESRALDSTRRHAVELFPTVDALCRAHGVQPADVSAVYVSGGPGSFTGLRIGITAARMLALAHGASIVAVPTLEVIAQNALEASPAPNRVVVLLDAKRGRVYAAAFTRQDDRYVAIAEPVEAEPASFIAGHLALDAACAVMGEGVSCHRDAIDPSGAAVLPESLYPPRVETVYRLGAARARHGRFDDRRSLIPVYIRPPEAQEKWEQRHARRDPCR